MWVGFRAVTKRSKQLTDRKRISLSAVFAKTPAITDMQIVCTRAMRFSSALVFQICRRRFIQILLAYYYIFEKQNKKNE